MIRLLVLCSLAWSVAATEPAFWLGDGTGTFAGQTVPTSFSATENVKWKAPLPNWCHGSPIVMAGKVFVVSEPLDYFPILTCHDAETGKELWRADLDPVEHMPGDKADLRQRAQEGWRWKRGMVTLWNEVADLAEAEGIKLGRLKGMPKQEGFAAKVEEKFGTRFKELDLAFKGFKNGAGGPQTFFDYAEPKGPRYQANQRLREEGLAWSSWSWFGTWDGVAYPTPAGDGERVYVETGQGLHACFDLAGKRLWARRFPYPDRRRVKELLKPDQLARVTDAKGKVGWPFNLQGVNSVSPVVADGRFVSMVNAMVRCFDPAGGEVLWEHPMRGGVGQNMCVPGVIELGGTTFVIVPPGEGRVGAPGDDIIRVADGKIVGILPGSTSSKMSASGPLISGDTVVSYSGDWRDRDVSCFRLRYDGKGTVAAEQLWSHKQKEMKKFSLWRAVAKDGRAHVGELIVDLADGSVIKEKLPTAKRNYCWHSGLIVGGHYISIDHAGGEFVFRTLDGKQVGTGTLPKNPEDGAPAERKLGETRGGQWNQLSAAMPFAYQNRLYIRSFDFLYCIGK